MKGNIGINSILLGVEGNIVDGHALVYILVDFVDGAIGLIIDLLIFNVVVLPLNVLESDDFDGLVDGQHLQDIEAFLIDDWQS